MHPVSVLTVGIFLLGYITARWDLVTRLYELAIFAWDHGVIVREFNLRLSVEDSLLTAFGADTRRQRLRRSFPLLRPCPHPHSAHCSSRGRSKSTTTRSRYLCS